MAGSKTTIEIDGKNTGAITSINGVKQELTGLGNTIAGPFSNSMLALNKMLSFGAIAGAVSSLGYLTKHTIDTADEISKLSQKIGISTESLSTLRYAAELSDLSLDQMSTAVRKLSTNLYDVSTGSGKDVRKSFDDLGITVTDSNGKLRATEEVLLQVADRFSNMTDGTEKTALAVKLFGRSGMEMIPFLNQGRDGIEALTNEAEKLGLKISTETGKAAEQFNDSLTTFKSQITGLANEAIPPLLNTLNDFTTGVMDLNSAVQKFGGENLFQGLYRAISNIQTMGIDLDKLFGIDAEIKKFIEFKKHTDELNKSFVQTFLTPMPAIVGSINSENGVIDEQIKKVKKLKDEMASLVETKAKGSPQGVASQALGISNMQFADYKAPYEMFQVEENPFDPLANYAIDFFDMYDERSSDLRLQTSTMFGNMGAAAAMFYEVSGRKSKEWFAIQKGFNIAQALMNTYEGATKALAQGGFFGIAMAATVIAAGLAQVAMIAAQQPTQSAGGGNAGTGSASRSIPTTQLPSNNTGKAAGQTINVVINGTVLANDIDKFSRDLIQSINKAVDDGLLIS